VSAQRRVEHQKQNPTASYQSPVGFVVGVHLDYSWRLKSVQFYGEKPIVGE